SVAGGRGDRMLTRATPEPLSHRRREHDDVQPNPIRVLRGPCPRARGHRLRAGDGRYGRGLSPAGGGAPRKPGSPDGDLNGRRPEGSSLRSLREGHAELAGAGETMGAQFTRGRTAGGQRICAVRKAEPRARTRGSAPVAT